MWLDPEYTLEEARKDIKMLSLWHTSLFLSFWHLCVVSLGIFKRRPFFSKKISPDLGKNQVYNQTAVWFSFGLSWTTCRLLTSGRLLWYNCCCCLFKKFRSSRKILVMSYLTCSVYCSHSTCRWCPSGQREGGLIWGQHYFALVLETNHKNRLGSKDDCPCGRRSGQAYKSLLKGNTTLSDEWGWEAPSQHNCSFSTQ